MGVKQLDHLNFSVADLEVSAAWYGRVFDFERVESGIADGVPWAILRAGEAMLCIYEHPTREHLGDQDLAARDLHGLSHFGLRITDGPEFEEAAAREGLEVLYGGVVRWPHSQAWYVQDPTGYMIEVALWQDDTIRFG